jgi:polyisoprenoid-binding protein YceI
MARGFYMLALAAVCLAGSAWAQRPIPRGTVREGTLSFDGHATTGDFVGTTATLTGEMSGGPSLGEVRGWVEAPVATLKTGNGHRDRDLNKSMQTDQFPVMRFDLSGVDPPEAAGDSVEATLRGQFTIHGVTKEALIPASILFGASGVRVMASTPLNLKDYQIGGLSKMLGVLKMSENITVHIDVTFAYQE